MSSESVTTRGIARGKTIELEREPGLPDGQQVKVTMEPADKESDLSPGEGLRRSAGAWADDAEGLDRYLEWNRQQRKLGRRERPE
ncbi:MAG TPA: hypothetical protein PLL20_08220 [Phycisphaerae bacterium]|nr:hypothetical protein [Phycisphaerae bacterium]HRR85453.1 hypothetical protein [Phycisphaerae bacterium]